MAGLGFKFVSWWGDGWGGVGDDVDESVMVMMSRGWWLW